MRILRLAGPIALAAVWTHGVDAQRPDATAVLAAARQALGGNERLGAITSFVATGRTRQLRGDNLVPIEFEIDCELPDRYVRHDEFPAQDIDPAVSGFSGNDIIQSAPGRGAPPAPAGPQRLNTIKQDFARLMLGVFAASPQAFPVTFTYAATGQAPEGTADILDVAGPANFKARLVVQQATHLPVMLMWSGPPAGPRGPSTPPAGAVGGAAAPAAPPPVEYRLFYGDYRTVDGVKWPFRIRRAVAGNTIEETTFDRVAFNVKIDPRKFEAPK